MRLLAALLFGLSSASLAQTTTDQRSATFSFNQANLAINLDQKDFETIYRTDHVPDTCYRDEIQGSRTECHTEYDRQCSTSYETQCHTERYPVCRTVPRRECHTTQQCRTVPDKVCNSHGCTTIQRRVCNPVESCRTTNDQVCHTESRNVCENVPRQHCQDIPRQVCIQVPNVVKVPYACTRPVQVPIGQQLKLQTVAKVAINLVNFAEVGATADTLIAQLSNGVVSISAMNANTNAFLYQVVAEQRSEQVISATEKVVTYSISVMATSIQKLNEFLSSQITNGKLFYDRLEFNLLGSLNVPVKGHLKLLQYKNPRTSYIIIDDDFGAEAVVGRTGLQTIAFNNFGVSSLRSATHYVELALRLDLSKLQNKLINPGALVQVADKAVLSSFEAYPQ